MRRLLIIVLLAAFAAIGQAQNAVRYFPLTRGQIEIWPTGAGAPVLAKRGEKGWEVKPAEARTDPAWIDLLSKALETTNNDIWSLALNRLDDSEGPVKGFKRMDELGQLVFRLGKDFVRVTALQPMGTMHSAVFREKEHGGWASDDEEALTDYLKREFKLTPKQLAGAIPGADPGLLPFTGMLDARPALNERVAVLVKRSSGESVVVAATIPDDAFQLGVPADLGLTGPALDANTGDNGTSKGGPGLLWLWTFLAFVSGGAAVYALLRWGPPALRGRVTTSASPEVSEDDQQLAANARMIYKDFKKDGYTGASNPQTWMSQLHEKVNGMTQNLANAQKKVERISGELSAARTSIVDLEAEKQTVTANFAEYKRSQAGWEKGAAAVGKAVESLCAGIVRAEQEAGIRGGALTLAAMAGDADKRVEESLKQANSRMAALFNHYRDNENAASQARTRAQEYADLIDLVKEAHNYMRGELSDDGLFGAYGYLLNFSAVQLVTTLARANRTLEKAMLQNLASLAGGFKNDKCKQLKSRAESLEARLSDVVLRPASVADDSNMHLRNVIKWVRDQHQRKIGVFHASVGAAGETYSYQD